VGGVFPETRQRSEDAWYVWGRESPRCCNRSPRCVWLFVIGTLSGGRRVHEYADVLGDRVSGTLRILG
jgi:hypothetical protein